MTVEVPRIPATEEPLPFVSPVETTRPEVHLTPRQWVRKNLFPTPVASVLTVVLGLALAYGLYRLAWFALVSSDWEIIRANLRRFMAGGQFPLDEAWRLWAALYVAAATAGLFTGAVAANAAEQAEAAGRPIERPGRWSWVRRYWPALAAVAVILSQTRTFGPLLATAGAALVLAGSRGLGLRLPGLAQHLAVGLLVALLVGYTLVAGSGGGSYSLADLVQLLLIAGAVLASTRALGRRPIRFAVLVLILGAVLTVQLTAGDGVGWNDWGGLLLTVFVSLAGIALSFPLGVLVALGRRSSLPVLRSLAVGYIELIRGVPLVALLFLGQYVIPLLYPNTVEPPSSLARAMVAIVLFEAAYVAETVRGGLQSIPRGQREAAQALGLSPWKITRLIVLPQALRAVIPAMVGQFISLFKDTSLLQIIGFVELLEVAENAPSQERFIGQGLHTVTFAFAALIFWAGSYTMSRESRRLERRLGVGERR
jgi:general L-amino acid transport system permease protein